MTTLISTLFNGPDNSAALAEQQRERELSQIAQARQKQQTQDASTATAGQLASARVARGQRLLVSKEAGGLSDTVGGA